jgi:hypothetical protein
LASKKPADSVEAAGFAYVNEKSYFSISLVTVTSASVSESSIATG